MSFRSATATSIRDSGGYTPIDLTEEVPEYLSDRHSFDKLFATATRTPTRFMDMGITQTTAGERLQQAARDLIQGEFDDIPAADIANHVPEYYLEYIASLPEDSEAFKTHTSLFQEDGTVAIPLLLLERIVDTYPLVYCGKRGGVLVAVEMKYRGNDIRIVAHKSYLYYGILQEDGSYTYFRNKHIFRRNLRAIQPSQQTQ